MKYVNVRVNLIVPNVHWGMNLHECDLLSLSKSNYATEFEIKTSKQDLLNDQYKKHNHESDKIKYLYFVVPETILHEARLHVPKHAGIFFINSKNRVREERKAIANKKAIKWTNDERLKLAHLGCMRILSLKNKLLRLK